MTAPRRDEERLAKMLTEIKQNYLKYGLHQTQKVVSVLLTELERIRCQELASKWIRENPNLCSIRKGLSVQNIDLWVHQYKIYQDRLGGRNINNLMLVEIKTHEAKPNYAQRDTLSITSQLIHTGKRYKKVIGDDGRKVWLRCWGVHYLTLSGDCPSTSKTIHWDGHPIDIPTLEELLIFQRDPDTLKLRSERRHHKITQRVLFGRQAESLPLFSNGILTYPMQGRGELDVS